MGLNPPHVLIKRNETKRQVQSMFRSYKEAVGCAKCKKSYHHFALTIDHIKPLGHRQVNSIAQMTMFNRIINDPNVQILCRTCHAVKTRINKDYLPRNPKPSVFDSLTPGQQTSYRSSQNKRRKVCTYLDAARLARGCSCCGYNEHYSGLDFDHIQPERRSKDNNRITVPPNILKAYEFMNNPNIQILCANCHAIKTWYNGDHLKGGH